MSQDFVVTQAGVPVSLPDVVKEVTHNARGEITSVTEYTDFPHRIAKATGMTLHESELHCHAATVRHRLQDLLDRRLDRLTGHVPDALLAQAGECAGLAAASDNPERLEAVWEAIGLLETLAFGEAEGDDDSTTRSLSGSPRRPR